MKYMTRREMDREANSLFDKMFNALKWFVIVVVVSMFFYYVQTLYLINFDRAVNTCMQTTGLNLIECKNLAK